MNATGHSGCRPAFLEEEGGWGRWGGVGAATQGASCVKGGCAPPGHGAGAGEAQRRPAAYLAADGLHSMQPIQGLLRAPQVLLKLRV